MKYKLKPRIAGPFNLTRRISDNAYQLKLQGKYYLSISFNVTGFFPFIADPIDLRTNLFQQGEDNAIMDSSKDLKQGARTDHEETIEHEEMIEHGAKDALEVPLGSMNYSSIRKFNQAIRVLLDQEMIKKIT